MDSGGEDDESGPIRGSEEPVFDPQAPLGEWRREVGQGDIIGEITLLSSCKRTATVITAQVSLHFLSPLPLALYCIRPHPRHTLALSQHFPVCVCISLPIPKPGATIDTDFQNLISVSLIPFSLGSAWRQFAYLGMPSYPCARIAR